MTEFNCEFSLSPSLFLGALSGWVMSLGQRNPRHLSSLPFEDTRTSSLWTRQSNGEETTHHHTDTGPETPFWAWEASSQPAAAIRHLLQPLKRGSVGALAGSLSRLPPHPQLCMHSLLPSAKLVGPYGLRHLCSTSFPMPPGFGWHLACLPTDFDISPSVWP